MKYRNEKESFQEYMERFRQHFLESDTYVIWGAGEKSKKIRERLPDNILFGIDNDKKKQGTDIDGLAVKSPDALKELKENNIKIIVAVHEYVDIFKQLEDYGIPEERYCNYREWLLRGDYLLKGCISVPEVSFIVNNRCTLSCRGCIEYIPYTGNKRDFPFKEIKESVDYFFQYADYVWDVVVVGGETLLYKDLAMVLKYLYEHYAAAGRVKNISIMTNGTVMPDEDVLQALKSYDITVRISDYKNAIGNQNIIDKLLTAFSQRKIKYQIENHFSRVEEGKWFDMGNPLKCRNMTEKKLREHFDKCAVACWAVWDAKLFNCNGVRSNIANLGAEGEPDNDWCDLRTDNKEKFIKYYLGYNNKGYYKFCNYCNGYGEYINRTSILPGEQMQNDERG